RQPRRWEAHRLTTGIDPVSCGMIIELIHF
uniref:Uncharacterized protein n=1 Tax=Anopheles atroparvus TaxID=41427 RepID=A0AAG5DHJ8_ANOAO